MKSQNLTKVTHLAWISKNSKDRSKGQLIKLKSEHTYFNIPSNSATSSASKEMGNISNVSTPIKQIGNTPQSLFEGTFDLVDFDLTPMKPMWIPHMYKSNPP